MNNYLIIVAGGTGNRMNNTIPKQFIQLNGKEIILYSIEKFRLYQKQIPIIIAVHKEYLEWMQQLLTKHKLENIEICEGGETRFHSVKKALRLLKDKSGIVGIHDAARPFVSVSTIHRCFDMASKKLNAVPSIPVGESLRVIENNKNKAVPRNQYSIIQTPQCFDISKIQKAYEVNYNENFTDDASVYETAGESIYLVEGNSENIKITHPNDLIIAQAYLNVEQ
ncbi:MAG: 2-C-methyl-D-erythritol 4-phosphate cytidylyltransferase [Sphingobacteriaceae bacterium]|nr:2-C-methyl-D-erythritol 4-phosphate cytidylyltransferase [Sphingobacteriaceae bacterium]